MKHLLTMTAAAAALALTAPASAHDRQERSDEAFAELVEGRVAGEPQSCIRAFRSNRLRVIENVGIAYERGDTLWVARTDNPRDLGPWDIPIIRRHGSQLCRHDVRETVDRSSGMFSGILFLNEFVPYRRAEEG
ncbi:hypothetical protein CP97_00970 [Aurantiacibacter atlanticus]|uniref:Uncharacterized protein n=1 Tax=Aurantiacibacter atlanticus TaxID=1648404 RepID=A0A0H4VCW3_9SPHN|nr:hypothetical protein [Aurantiacibacter atlanticus]AKQ40924.1 hypothetical protein CP97_00970 [Aurantiacibacter atlanticus]MDF1834291.1 hypothetical protein [Alteraurantiacibacter sp. bin_em_oilr2.035]